MASDHLSIQKRVKIGQSQEDLCIRCMNRYLLAKRQKLIQVRGYEDKFNKTDAFLVDLEGDPEDMSRRCAIKVREAKQGSSNRDDILVDVREPWYGEVDPRSKTGRDMVINYHWYITRDDKLAFLRIASGSAVHDLVNKLWQEWVERGYEEKPELKVMRSLYNPGCEMRLHRDKRSGVPKILAFIPPAVLGGDVFFVTYDEEEIYNEAG